MKASCVPSGKTKSASFTSTSLTSTPNDRRAFATPFPVAMETSRSEPGPPIRTAIFLGSAFMISFRTRVSSGERTRLACWRWRPRHRELFPAKTVSASRRNQHASRVRSPEQISSFLPHDLHFGFQLYSALFARRLLNFRDQLKHLIRGRAAIVHDKVPVNFRDACLPHTRVLQPQFIHQFARRNGRWILENAACALGRRLRCPALFLRFVEPPLDLVGRSRRPFENRGDGVVLLQGRDVP